jgi:hypothetical protein
VKKQFKEKVSLGKNLTAEYYSKNVMDAWQLEVDRANMM